MYKCLNLLCWRLKVEKQIAASLEIMLFHFLSRFLRKYVPLQIPAVLAHYDKVSNVVAYRSFEVWHPSMDEILFWAYAVPLIWLIWLIVELDYNFWSLVKR